MFHHVTVDALFKHGATRTEVTALRNSETMRTTVWLEAALFSFGGCWFLSCLFFLQVRWTQHSVLCLGGGQRSSCRWGIFPPHSWRGGAGEPGGPIGKLLRRGGGRGRRQQHEQQQPIVCLLCSDPADQPWAQNNPDCQQPQQCLQGESNTTCEPQQHKSWVSTTTSTESFHWRTHDDVKDPDRLTFLLKRKRPPSPKPPDCHLICLFKVKLTDFTLFVFSLLQQSPALPKSKINP